MSNMTKQLLSSRAELMKEKCLEDLRSMNKLTSVYDSQMDTLILAYCMVRARHEYEQAQSINSVTYSMLYNCFDIPSYHTEIVQVQAHATKNTVIESMNMFHRLLSNKYTTNCTTATILDAKCINKSNKYFLEIQLSEPVSAITFCTNEEIINSIFAKSSRIEGIVENREIYTTNCKCELQVINIFDYCFYNKQGYIFTVSDINIQGVNKTMTIQIPMSSYIYVEPFSIKCNILFLENKFQYAHSMEIIGPGKHIISIPSEYQILSIDNVYINEEVAASARQSINGWYISYEGNNCYIHIDAPSDSVCMIYMTCRQHKISTANIQPVEYKPISITEPKVTNSLELSNANYVNKFVMVMQSYHSNNFHALFELIKLYYEDIKYNIHTKLIAKVVYDNGRSYIRQGQQLQIECNIESIPFRYAMTQELMKYVNVAEVIWK